MNRLAILIVFLATAAAAQLSADEMKFDIIYMNHTNVIAAEGEITAETPARFQEFLNTTTFDGFRLVMALDSPGGSLMGGMELGQMIREMGLSTEVAQYPVDKTTGRPSYAAESGVCMSACALAFLGGERRVLERDSLLGFHQFSSAQGSLEVQESVYITESVTQLLGATVLGYIMSMGIEPALYARLSQTLPQDIWLPEPEELETLKIVTPTAFRDFQFAPYLDGVIAYSVLPENIEGRSVVGQITAYCRNGDPYLLLSGVEGEGTIGEAIRSTIAEYHTGFALVLENGNASLQVPAANVDIRLSDGLPLAEVRLTREMAELMKLPVLGRIEVSAASGAMLFFRTSPNYDDRAALDAAFRLCIR